MIEPANRLVVLAWLGAPLALVLGLFAPGYWPLALGWLVIVGALGLADAVIAADRRRVTVEFNAPSVLYTGLPGTFEARIAFGTGAPPHAVDVILEANATAHAAPARVKAICAGRNAQARFTLAPQRRGEAKLERLWLRWRGPFGLVSKQRAVPLGHVVPVVPDTHSVTKEAIRIFSRFSAIGQKPQLQHGGGSEFEALKEFAAGMDRRAIDWKQSARHRMLLAKEFCVEHNHTIVFAIDSGRMMCEPVGGAARVDHALNASLLLAFVSLKLGDRVSFFSFDARPRLSTGAVANATSFPLLQRLTAGIDYSDQETNYTLGLTSLSAELQRRSLIVVFTEFADTTNAELMIENVSRLVRRHLVLFVAFRDEELEELARAEPREPEDVTRAVLASSLLSEREKVIVRLQRLGAEIIDAPAKGIGVELINRYFALTRGARL
ncbi:MAG: DUF58 domain-containing protein [Maricaulaceae bacterium]|jgi:uncharacterized protein (DUF58 family)